MFNLLSNIILQNVSNGKLDFIGKMVQIICDTPAYSIGIGVIIFTLILKLITLPFDVMSKVSTKKNALKMEKMRPELEKLQKQYANDKQLYQQKVMALQKKEGYSPFSSCLPSILSIIVFFVVIGGFNDYSTFANRRFANEMINAYNAKIISMDIGVEVDTDGTYISTELDKNKVRLYDEYEDSSLNYANWANINYTTKYNDADNGMTSLYNDLSLAKIRYDKIPYIAADNTYGLPEIVALPEIIDFYFKQAERFKKDELGNPTEEKEFYYIIDLDGNLDNLTLEEQEIQQNIINYYMREFVPINYFNEVLIGEAQEAAKEAYFKNRDSFFWIKNIWVADSTFKHPLEGASAYKMNGDEYNLLTGRLGAEKSAKNGYFILVVLSIVIMFLSQLIMEKEQKSQMELQSVEGANSTAGQTQKMMKWIMPIMFGVFAFLYTASFSIYMIVSSAFSIISSLLINIIVKKVFDKKALQEELQRDKRIKIKK